MTAGHPGSEVRVREAVAADLDVLVDFIAEEAREAEGLAPDRQTLETGIGKALGDPSLAQYWILEDEQGVSCGCTSIVREWSDWNAGFYWWIQSMYIEPSQRGKGHLERLLDAVTIAARTQGCLDLRLYVHEKNIAARRAYARVGFEASSYRIMSRGIRT